MNFGQGSNPAIATSAASVEAVEQSIARADSSEKTEVEDKEDLALKDSSKDDDDTKKEVKSEEEQIDQKNEKGEATEVVEEPEAVKREPCISPRDQETRITGKEPKKPGRPAGKAKAKAKSKAAAKPKGKAKAKSSKPSTARAKAKAACKPKAKAKSKGSQNQKDEGAKDVARKARSSKALSERDNEAVDERIKKQKVIEVPAAEDTPKKKVERASASTDSARTDKKTKGSNGKKAISPAKGKDAKSKQEEHEDRKSKAKANKSDDVKKRLSRKSAAYVKAKKRALAEGASLDDAKSAAKKVVCLHSGFSVGICVCVHTLYVQLLFDAFCFCNIYGSVVSIIL